MINKLPVKQLVEFRRYSDRRRQSFADNLKTPKEPDPENEGGGNYWTRSLSALSCSFRDKNNKHITDKIEEVLPLYEASDDDRIRTMYKRNIEILQNYEDFDFSTLMPTGELKFLKKSQLLLTIKDIPLQVIPHHIFAFGTKEEPQLGSIWFVTWLEKFKADELGIFAEAMYKYLVSIYPDKYKVDPQYCMIMDTLSMQTVSYDQIVDGTLPSLLESSIDTLNKYM